MTLHHTYTLHMDVSAVAVYMGDTNLAGICGSVCLRCAPCDLPFCFCIYYTLGTAYKDGRLLAVKNYKAFLATWIKTTRDAE